MRKPTKISIIGDLSANDDFFHDTQDTENFMESNLFYFAGKTTSSKNIGGIIRIANRPNQGHADATVLYFPGDRSALFHYERPEISGNTSWRASGLEIDVVTPGGIEFRSSYHGDALHLKNPRLLANPKLAYQEPKRRLAIQLSHFGKSPMTELKYKRETMDAGMEDISATKGLHQLTSFVGNVAIDDCKVETVEGFGWRDHNWGPRNWQAFPKHAFYTGNFSKDVGFVLFKTEGGLGYFMHEGPDKLHEVTALKMVTNYLEDGREPVSMHAEVGLDNGNIHIIEGQKIDFIPLRNRRNNMTTHLGYSLWKYQLDGQKEGLGIAEHMSQSKS